MISAGFIGSLISVPLCISSRLVMSSFLLLHMMCYIYLYGRYWLCLCIVCLECVCCKITCRINISDIFSVFSEAGTEVSTSSSYVNFGAIFSCYFKNTNQWLRKSVTSYFLGDCF